MSSSVDAATIEGQRLELEELREIGDRLADAVFRRWDPGSVPGFAECSCECCVAAREWKAARA